MKIKQIKKAVAIPYVIALILGVTVIGILVYWLINQAGKTTSAGTSAECQAETFNFCLKWQNNDKTCKDGKPTESIEGCSTPEKSHCEAIGLCK